MHHSAKVLRLFRSLAAVAILGGWGMLAGVHPAQAELKAGVAMTNITPPLGELIVGGFHPVAAKDIHDELHARCLVLDDGKVRLAFVVCDNVGITRDVYDVAKAKVNRLLGIPFEHQLMSATHTHSATNARSRNAMVYETELSDYQKFVASRIADAVQLAVHRLRPAKIGWGAVDEPSQLFNRRWFVADEADRRNPFGGVDQVRMNPSRATLIRPAGPIDPQLSFVSVQDLEDQPVALLANYSLHYVGGGASSTISADYFAVFAEELSKMLGASASDGRFLAMMTNGTSGDVNNINFLDRGPNYQPYQKMTEVGNLLAQRVYQALKGLEYRSDLTLDGKAAELKLQVRKPDPELLAYVEKVKAKPAEATPYHPHEKIYADRVMMQAQSPDEVAIVLQTFRIGSLGITAIPFEVFTETGLELKELSPFKPTFNIELANGSYGYLPTPRQHTLGGYETWLGTNKVEVQASKKIVAKLLELFEQMR
jgi:neutral ceramidase